MFACFFFSFFYFIFFRGGKGRSESPNGKAPCKSSGWSKLPSTDERQGPKYGLQKGGVVQTTRGIFELC